MAEISMLQDLAVSSGPEPIHSGTQRISVSDHVNGVQYNAQKSDSFAIEIDTFSRAINKDSNTNSRITLQRSLSRKGSQRHGEKKINCSPILNESEAGPATSLLKACSTPEKGMAVGQVDYKTHPQFHHQITITSSSISNTPTESKSVIRRNSFRWSPSSWIIDPKRIKHRNDPIDILHPFNMQTQRRGIGWRVAAVTEEIGIINWQSKVQVTVATDFSRLAVIVEAKWP